jgi:lipid II:glycine glycyltransferase (peptidoglycan interpeptide bridge formation enzyme)
MSSKPPIFQTPEFLKVLETSVGFDPFLIKSLTSEGEGFVQGYITRENNFIKNILTRRAIIFGNPVVDGDSKTILNNLLAKLIENLKGRAIYVEFRNLTDQSDYKTIYTDNGFEYEDHLDIIVDLTKSEEELWKDVNSKRRNEVRRATKEGTSFKVVDDLESLQVCYSILKEVYSRAKLPLYNVDFFENLYKYLNGEAKLHVFTAQYEEKIIGCMLALGYNGVLYDFYAGAKSEFYKKYPNDLIPWEVFLWGKHNGYHTFDFGGAGKPDVPYKVRDYKKQFGGELVNYGRFKLILNKPLYKLGELGVKLLKKYG